MGSDAFAVLRGLLGRSGIDVSEQDACCPRFGECEACLFANATCTLTSIVSTHDKPCAVIWTHTGNDSKSVNLEVGHDESLCNLSAGRETDVC